MLILPSLPLALGLIALSYHSTIYFGLAICVAALLLDRFLRKTIRKEIAELQDDLRRRALR